MEPIFVLWPNQCPTPFYRVRIVQINRVQINSDAESDLWESTWDRRREISAHFALNTHERIRIANLTSLVECHEVKE
jgi:hypothetical protein